MNQRWHTRRSIFRPDEPIRTADYDVAELPDDTTAKAFVTAHHYSGSYPAARFRFGLFRHGELAGVAVFSHPLSAATVTKPFGGRPTESVELGRFVLLDEVPGNGETWFLGHCLRALARRRLRGVVSFSDPVPREGLDGQVVFPGHIGTIYQAANAAYLGRATPRTLKILPDGTVFSDRALQKVRARERGWEYAAGRLVEFGADPLLAGDDSRAWLNRWLPELTRLMRHPGNHKYAWALNAPRLTSGRYPKRDRLVLNA